MLLSLIQMIRAFRNYQSGVAELSQLSDRKLADIGLNRSDIPRGWSALFPTHRGDSARGGRFNQPPQ